MRIMGAATTAAPSASSARTSSSACSRARVTAMRRPSRGGREERGDCDIRVISSNVPLTALRSRPLCRAPGGRLPAPRPQARGLVAGDRLRTDARVRRVLPRARAAAAGPPRPLGGARRPAAGDLSRRAGRYADAAARFARAHAAGGGAEALWLNAQALFQAGDVRAAEEALHLWATQVPGGQERLSEARAELFVEKPGS